MMSEAKEQLHLAEALAAAHEELERERAAHRKTQRREALATLERANADEDAAQREARSAGLQVQAAASAAERNVVLQHLAALQRSASKTAAELAALRVRERVDPVERDVALRHLAAVHEFLAARSAEVETLCLDLGREREAREALRRELADGRGLAEAHAATAERLVAALAEREALLHQVARMQDELDARAAANANQADASEALRARLRALEDANRALLELAAALQQRCASSESALREVLSSRSWRLTAPVRRIMARARPAGGRGDPA